MSVSTENHENCVQMKHIFEKKADECNEPDQK